MRIRTSSTNESAGDHFWKTALITCESNYSAGLGCPGRCLHFPHPILNCQHLPASQQLGLIKQIWSWTSLNIRDSGRLGGQYIHNSLNASRQIKLKTFTGSPPRNFWRKQACRSEPSWPIFSLITSTALKTEEHKGQLHQSCRFLPEMSAISAQIWKQGCILFP